MQYEVTTHRFICQDEANRLHREGALTTVHSEPIGMGMSMRVVRLPDGTLWRGRYDIEYLGMEPVEEVTEIRTAYRSLNL